MPFATNANTAVRPSGRLTALRPWRSRRQHAAARALTLWPVACGGAELVICIRLGIASTCISRLLPIWTRRMARSTGGIPPVLIEDHHGATHSPVNQSPVASHPSPVHHLDLT